MIFGHVCERKGASDTWVIEKIKEDFERLGYQDVILKGDCEPALVQVLENVNICPRSTFHNPARTGSQVSRVQVSRVQNHQRHS